MVDVGDHVYVPSAAVKRARYVKKLGSIMLRGFNIVTVSPRVRCGH